MNHQLRGSESEADEDFVIAQTDELNLAITTKRLDVRGFARKNKLSIETAARKLRIESLLDIAKANNCSCIATAHHKNDNAETVLQRLVRGTGFRGLAGIWPMRVFAGRFKFVRPLLCVRRDEIISYLKERGLKWRVDRTNEDYTYRRNYIRHQLLPALQQDSSDFVIEQLFDLSQSAQGFYGLVCDSAEKVWPELSDCADDRVVLDLKRFLTQGPAVKVELVRRSLTHLGSGERNLTQGHFERILRLAEQKISGRKIELPNKFVVWREYENLVFARAERSSWPDEQISKSTEVEVQGRTKFDRYLIEATVFEAGECDVDPVRDFFLRGSNGVEKFKVEKSKSVEWFDLDNVSLPLVVRFRQAGDRFVPLGLEGEKRIGKFLTAAKVPQEIRQELLIVADSEKIIWVWPIRMSEQAKVTTETRKILQLQINDAMGSEVSRR